MKYIRYIFEQAILITVGITLAISIEGLISYINGEEIYFSWYMPGSAILGGLFCAIPSTLLLGNLFEKKKSVRIVRIIIHCIVLYIINALCGWLFRWFTSLSGFIFVSISFFAVYAFAWGGSFLINKQEDKEINEALNDIRDEE